MKRVLASILLLAMLLALCACSSVDTPSEFSTAEPTAPGSSAIAPGASTVASASKTTPADTFVYATNGEPGNLDPQNNAYLMGQIITNCIYDTLVTRNAETGEIFPALATDWEFTDDTHLRLSIREDVSFHNGDKLTVDDVVYSIQRMCASSASSSYYGFINPADTKALNDNTVEIAMNYAFSGALNFLSNPRGAIVSKSYTEQGGDDTMARAPMGTGAFIFDEWVEGDRVNCHRNDNYWGDKPSYTNLTVRFIADASTRFIELETGGVDACDNISGSNYSRMLNGVDGCVLYDTLSTKTFYIVCNDEHDVVSNVNVRKALAYALDLPAIVKAAYGDSATVADSSVAATLPFYESQAQYYAGEIVEYGSLAHIFKNPQHPYTKGLFDSLPRLEEDVRRLRPINGLMPDPTNLPSGCKFHGRCPFCMEKCTVAQPDAVEVEPGHQVQCWLVTKGAENE